MPSEMHTTLTCEIVGMSWTRQVPGCKRTPRDTSVAESGPETVQNGLSQVEQHHVPKAASGSWWHQGRA